MTHPFLTAIAAFGLVLAVVVVVAGVRLTGRPVSRLRPPWRPTGRDGGSSVGHHSGHGDGGGSDGGGSGGG